MPDRHLWTRHSTKTITFAGGTGTGAAGTVAVFTITGRVLVHWTSVFCTTLLTESGATATISYGTAGDVDAFIAATDAVTIDADEWWTAAAPAAGSKSPLEILTGGLVVSQGAKLLSESTIFTVATADVTGGVVVVDHFYTPLTDGARLF